MEAAFALRAVAERTLGAEAAFTLRTVAESGTVTERRDGRASRSPR